MTGQHEPGLVGPGSIAHEETDVLRRVTGRVQHLRSDVAERKHLFVANSPERKRDFRVRGEHIFGAGCFGELPAGRQMVGMNMGVDDEMDAHAGGFRRA